MSIVLALFALLLNVHMCYSSLSPTGTNVVTKYEPYYVTEKTSKLAYYTERVCTKTCGTHIVFCWNKKTVCKDERRSKWVTVYKSVKRQRPVYSCKHGWKQDGAACTIPECYGCFGHGECDSPWKCKCNSGWKGERCKEDIDECSLSSLNECKYKPGCTNTLGSYSCACPVGYSLHSDGRTCDDIDECIRRTHTCSNKNGCRNTPGGYTCTCETGYYLDSDQRTCKDVDECSSFKNGCGYKGGCKNTIGSYTCSCLPGYDLDVDGRTCKDVDECKNSDCQQKCVNYPGGYSCACHKGYRRNTKDRKRCDDIDECVERKGGCSQTCTNTPGSFDCSCNAGYVIGGDKKSCVDFDECKSGLHSCQHICLNTIGSYKCKCRPGFELSKDGKTCIGNLCRPIHTPANGKKTCSGYRNTDTCIFSCSPGYKQIGSDIRTCVVSRRWTGKETKCEPIHCSPPKPKPKHGFIYSPCNTRFGSQCFAGCDNGYYKNGTAKITCSVKGAWEPTQITCHEIKACKPNPCRHGGRCTVVTFNQFSCNCSGTGWQGKTCERGVILKPHFPALVAGVPTKSLEFRASPPDEYFILTPSSRYIQFNPPTLFFGKHSSAPQSLTITARYPGLLPVQFKLNGPGAAPYDSLEPILFFVQSKRNAINNNGKKLTFPFGRCKLELDKCPGSDRTISAYSTSLWNTAGVTRGQISLRSGNIEVPHSVLGGSLDSTKRSSSSPSCAVPRHPVTGLVRQNVLAKSFLNTVRDRLPKWLDVKLHDNFPLNSTLETDLKAYYLSGKRLVEKAPMKGLPLFKDTFFSLLLSPDLDVVVHGDRVSFKKNDRSRRFAVALDLCSSSPNDIILRPSPGTTDVLNQLSVMKQLQDKGWKFNIESLQLSKKFFGKTATNRTLIMYATFSKQMNASANDVKSRVDFEGTVFVNVDNLNKIMDFPLDQKWHVELHGDIILTLEFKVQGKMTKLAIEMPKTKSYATFGGNNSREDCLHGNSGLTMAKVLEKNPFLGTELSRFIELDQTKKMSCFLSARLYNENQGGSFRYRESSNGVKISFDGVLKFGALRFEYLEVKLWVKNLHCSDPSFKQDQRVVAELTGSYGGNISTGKKLGIFEIPPGSVINLHVGKDSKAASGGSFSAVVNILGFRSAVNVNISYNGLEFQAEGKIYGLFYMVAVFNSGLASWKDQRYIATGTFERNVAEKDFNRVLEKELTAYSKEILSKAQQRIQLSADTEKRARSRLRDVQKLRDEWQKKVKEIRQESNEVEVQLDIANKDLEKRRDLVKKYSDEIRSLNEELNQLCTVKRCSKICQKGWSNSTCWTYIVAKKMGQCRATCHEPIQKRLPPSQVRSFCRNQHCRRIHRKHGIGFVVGLAAAFVFVPALPVVAAAAIGVAVAGIIGNANRGSWNCKYKQDPCMKQVFNYNYTYDSYDCQRPCMKQSINESIARPCNEMVDCASFVPDIRCIAENALCLKARKKALDVISKVKANAVRIVRSLDNAEQNVALWKMKKERVSIKLRAASTSLTMYEDAVQSLEKGYKVTVENHKRKLKILAKPLMLGNLLKKLGESFVMVQNTAFRAKVSSDYDTKLLPIDVTVVLNETQREEVYTVLDFKNLKRSLRSIAKEILSVYIGDVSLVRKKRSVESTNSFNDDLHFYTLQTYHRLCSEFSNHKQTLYDAAISIYTLASETQQILKDQRKRESSFVNLSTVLENVTINKTKAMELGVTINYDSNANELENDPLLQEAKGLRYEVLKNDVIHLSSKLLYKNWLTTMESIFGKISVECSGFDDCLKYTIDSLSEMIETGLASSRTKKLRTQIADVERKFLNLTRKSDMPINDIVHVSKDILLILENMTGVEDVCAQAPNITENPAFFTELAVNENLVLRCNATGDFLVYQWRFNGEILKNQTSNILSINKVSKQNSGNYSCDVSNHVAEVRSILALVVVGSRPSIISHPPSHRIVILSEYDSIHCQVKKDGYEVTYQWYFKSYKSSSYIMLSNERFSYLNFAPVKTDHKGWYYCKVSNKFGHTISKESFVEVLKYSLPVPAAKVSLTVTSISRYSNTSTLHPGALAKVLASRFSPTNNSTQRLEDRIKELSLKDCKFLTPGYGVESTDICDWTFLSIGENVTSAKTLSYNISEQNKRKLNAALKLKKLIGQLSNETNTKGITFSISKTNYSVSSLDISAIYFVCPKRQILITHVYKCVDCPRGYYGALVNGIATCSICPRNTYQPEPGQTSCIKCPEGSINKNQGAYDQKECKDQSKYFVSFLLINDHHGNVIVTTDVSGQVEIDNLKPKATVLKRMKWVTKKVVTVSAVEASTNEAVNINGQPVIHLEPTSKGLTSMKFLRIKAPKKEEPTEYINPFFPFLPDIITPTPTPTPTVTTKKPNLQTFYVFIVLENNYNTDVEVRINISGKLEDYYLRLDAALPINKSWRTKKMLSITAVDAATKQALYINGQSVIHLQSETLTSRNLEVKVLRIGGLARHHS